MAAAFPPTGGFVPIETVGHAHGVPIEPVQFLEVRNQFRLAIVVAGGPRFLFHRHAQCATRSKAPHPSKNVVYLVRFPCLVELCHHFRRLLLGNFLARFLFGTLHFFAFSRAKPSLIHFSTYCPIVPRGALPTNVLIWSCSLSSILICATFPPFFEFIDSSLLPVEYRLCILCCYDGKFLFSFATHLHKYFAIPYSLDNGSFRIGFHRFADSTAT